MAIYVDPLRACVPNKNWRWLKSCHMFADTDSELHNFACRIGLKRNWFQNRAQFPHYDLNPSRRNIAVIKGAIEVDFFFVAAQMKKRRIL